jgi:N6-L-threonylcarbamoyladenine synthase
MTVILGIETSCDETAAAIVEDGHDIRSSVVSSQVDLHARFGGVVPEIASRAHAELVSGVVAEALVEAGASLDDIDAVAACHGPGLAGALLTLDVPYVGVNHLEAHLHAAWLEDRDVELPLAVLIVSGGHTMVVIVEADACYRLLGQTVDDAAGEAFDKVARFLGLGYPGGPAIDRLAAEGDPTAIPFPRPMRNDGYDFSFSGLKTAVINYVRRHPDVDVRDVAASFQEAIVDVLMTKLAAAADSAAARTLVIGGGVAANSRLRARLLEVAEESGIPALLPRVALCTDNGAMIAATAWWRLGSDGPTDLACGAYPSLRLPTRD